MTRERYLEACEATGSEPVESEIPVELEELAYESQLALSLFNACPDNWDGMGGNYLGKRIECLPALFQIYGVDIKEQKYVFDLFKIMESEFYRYVATKSKQKQETTSGKANSKNP
jgi:hypothetical protein